MNKANSLKTPNPHKPCLGRPNSFVLFLPEIKECLLSKDFQQLKELLKGIHSMDLAEGWIKLEPQEKIIVFRLLSARKAVEVFEDLRFNEQSYLLNNLENQEAALIINEMAHDDRAKLFKDLKPKVVKKLFTVMKKEEVEDVRKLLTFKEGTSGSIMTTEFVELKKTMTARQALVHLQDTYKAGQNPNLYSVYVTNEGHRVVGGLSLQMLISAPSDILIKDIMSDVDLIKIDCHMLKEDVAAKFSKYDLLDAPVVDHESRLLGIITIDDVMDLIHKETTKEIYEIGKMHAGKGEEIRYVTATVRELVRRRAGWLVALLAFDSLTGTVLKNFEHAIGSMVALTFFIPMLLGAGGNAGTQTSITIIRGLATGDVHWKNVWKVARLEAISAIVMGFIVGVVAFLRAMMLQKDFFLSFVVGSTMTLVVLLAIFTGICLPLISKRLGMDPAALAGPITTSVVDMVGLIIYFNIARIFLPALNH
jgi:magnesium transporter